MIPVAEADPVQIDGVKVYRHVVARGDDLLKLGSLDNTRWVECDLRDTEWPTSIHNLTIIDSDISHSRWNFVDASDIKFLGTKRIKIAMATGGSHA